MGFYLKYLIRKALTSFGLTIFLCSMVGYAYAQPYEISKTPIDTVAFQDSYIVVYTDQTWQYLPEDNFDGVLNKSLHSMVSTDTTLKFKLFWNTEMPFTYDNDIKKLKDTIWLCSIDTVHSRWSIPFDGPVLSSFKYRGARFHHGLDIDLNVGDPVKSAFDGVVRYAQYNRGGFGNCVIIRHYNGLETYYAHLSKIEVRPYQRVNAGQIIGLGGNTGRSFGPHLHFEVRFYDNALDPTEIFDFENKKLRDENLFVCPSMFNYRAVSNKNILLERYKHNPEMRDKVQDDYEDGLHSHDHDNGRTNGEASHAVANPAVNKAAKYHKVRSGDTLGAIASKYGTSVDKLCKLNGLRKTSVIQIGQKIRVK